MAERDAQGQTKGDQAGGDGDRLNTEFLRHEFPNRRSPCPTFRTRPSECAEKNSSGIPRGKIHRLDVDNAAGDRHLICGCPPVSDYQDDDAETGPEAETAAAPAALQER